LAKYNKKTQNMHGFFIHAFNLVESRLSNVELGGVNGVKRGKSHQSITAAQAAIKK
jgi:hypothetical protein